ncbi:Meiotic nuclear division protein 1 [Geranomyces variabilis]|uniref:Meiotic nuclear division protein 1 n=1 Tax=Geranomyces variabilis TaxID=109894 RepID=A0AAD5TRA9_9FUNG|nr:Meiotic nuclear division protein 1 [Geranomyces variabilis]
MSKRKGLSWEEKRERMQEFFFETKDFWLLKDIEKTVPKTKGIVAQSVKEVLDSLVSDNIVTVEKIGTSNYYWSFPSSAVQASKRKLTELEEDHAKLTEERNRLLEQLAAAEAINRERRAELARFKDCDPTLIAAKDNIFALQSYCNRMYSIPSQQFAENFGIPEGFDTL